MAHPKHEAARLRYGACCGYCDVSESETAGELTIDHFVPVSAGGDDSDVNLVYACFRCNLHKSDFIPTPEDLAHGRRLLHPQVDDLSLHFRLDEPTGLLLPLSATGAFHIDTLRLNRRPLVQLRLRRLAGKIMEETIAALAAENAQLRSDVFLIGEELNGLRRLLASNEPNRTQG